MPKFSYYKKLTKKEKAIYDKSDAIVVARVKDPQAFLPFLNKIKMALAQEDASAVQRECAACLKALSVVFFVSVPKMKVLAVRPSNSHGELHGLYQFEGGPQHAVITLWLRTVKQKKVVAFKTFFRTLIHEFLHHLDYTALQLEDSFHTQGFYKRENSLTKQLFSVLEVK